MDELTLERIRREEQGPMRIDERVLAKVTLALQAKSLTHRELIHACHLSASTIDRVLDTLQSEGRVKVVELQNTQGPATKYISLLPSASELAEQRKKRLTILASKGLL